MTAPRSPALALYRAILREARYMPTDNRRRLVEQRAAEGFRRGAGERDPEQVDFLLQVISVCHARRPAPLPLYPRSPHC